MRCFIRYCACFALLFHLNSSLQLIAEDEGSIYDMSFEELRNIKVYSASILPLKSSVVPASITTITREDIAVTPARNIIDLIDTYVPGAMSQPHAEGPKIGVRGIITSNNTKYLLILNGRNINDKMKNGAAAELDHWNLNDIEKIEVIRGPGSVTYGPGAVGGVIRITTKNSKTFQGTRGGTLFNSEYRSNGAFLEHGFRNDDFGLYAFASIQRTEGAQNIRSFNADPTTGSHFHGDSDGVPPADYLADAFDTPQLKFHVDMDYADEWRWWTRYTQSGQTYYSNSQRETAEGLRNVDKLPKQAIISTLTHDKELNDRFSLSSMLSFDSQSFKTYSIRSADYPEEALLNRKFSFSESEMFLRSILEADVNEKLNLAVGAEYSYEWIRAPWFESERRLFISEGFKLINGADSEFSGDGSGGTIDPTSSSTLFVGDGWDYDMYSFLFEADYQLKDNTKILGSARYDKHSLTDGQLSPRLAYIYSPDKKHSVKFIAQRSVRLMRNSGIFNSVRTGSKADPEILKAYEVSLTRQHNSNLLFHLNTFYNDLGVIAFTNNRSTNVGNVQTAGVEVESEYHTNSLTFRASHSFVKQLDFKMDNDLKNSGTSKQGISPSDYRFVGDFITLNGTGNDLNNWHNQSTKFAVTYKPAKNWILHANTVVRWGMEGAKDELRMYEQAYDNVDTSSLSAANQSTFATEKDEALQVIKNLRDSDAFEMDARVNASATYNFTAWQSDMSLSLYLHNLLSFNDSKRYRSSTGSNKSFPDRADFIEEPFTVGLQLSASF